MGTVDRDVRPHSASSTSTNHCWSLATQTKRARTFQKGGLDAGSAHTCCIPFASQTIYVSGCIIAMVASRYGRPYGVRIQYTTGLIRI